MPPAGKVAPIPLNSSRSAASIRLRPPQCVLPKHLDDCRALIHALDLTCGAIQEILLVSRHACDNSPLRTRRPACAEPDHHAREDDFASHEASGAAHRTPPIPVRVVPGDDHCARRSAASDAKKVPATAAYIPRRRIHGRARLQLIAVPLRSAATGLHPPPERVPAPATLSTPMAKPKMVPACRCRSARSSSVTKAGKLSATIAPPLATATAMLVPCTTPRSRTSPRR